MTLSLSDIVRHSAGTRMEVSLSTRIAVVPCVLNKLIKQNKKEYFNDPKANGSIEQRKDECNTEACPQYCSTYATHRESMSAIYLSIRSA